MSRQRRSEPPAGLQRRRFLASLVLSAPLPLAFLAGGLLQAEGLRPPGATDVAAFSFAAPVLLFAMLVFAFWTLMHRRRLR